MRRKSDWVKRGILTLLLLGLLVFTACGEEETNSSRRKKSEKTEESEESKSSKKDKDKDKEDSAEGGAVATDTQEGGELPSEAQGGGSAEEGSEELPDIPTVSDEAAIEEDAGLIVAWWFAAFYMVKDGDLFYLNPEMYQNNYKISIAIDGNDYSVSVESNETGEAERLIKEEYIEYVPFAMSAAIEAGLIREEHFHFQSEEGKTITKIEIELNNLAKIDYMELKNILSENISFKIDGKNADRIFARSYELLGEAINTYTKESKLQQDMGVLSELRIAAAVVYNDGLAQLFYSGIEINKEIIYTIIIRMEDNSVQISVGPNPEGIAEQAIKESYMEMLNLNPLYFVSDEGKTIQEIRINVNSDDDDNYVLDMEITADDLDEIESRCKDWLHWK